MPGQLSPRLRLGKPLFRNANTGAGQDFTGLTAVVQLRLRVAIFQSDMWRVTSDMIRHNAFATCHVSPVTCHVQADVAQQRQQQFRKLPGIAPRECESLHRPHFRIRGEIIIILRFERRVCRWESCRMHHFHLRFQIYDIRYQTACGSPRTAERPVSETVSLGGAIPPTPTISQNRRSAILNRQFRQPTQPNAEAAHLKRAQCRCKSDRGHISKSGEWHVASDKITDGRSYAFSCHLSPVTCHFTMECQPAKRAGPRC